MHALIIKGGSAEIRNQKTAELLSVWKISPYDTIVLENTEKSIGIAEIRKTIPAVNRTPQYSPFTVVVIRNAETLTIEAQNALLKTLEEPPVHTRIIIEVSNPDKLLPTILSRCQTDARPNTDSTEINPEILDLFKSFSGKSVGDKMLTLDKGAKIISDPTLYIYELFRIFHRVLLEKAEVIPASTADTQISPDLKTTAGRINHLIGVSRFLSANINPKIAFDYLAFPGNTR
jgi:hypothetical protein